MEEIRGVDILMKKETYRKRRRRWWVWVMNRSKRKARSRRKSV